MKFYTEILTKLPVVLLLIISACGVTVGDYFAKTWSINQKTVFLLIAFVGYFSATFFYIPTLLKEGLVVTSVIWSLFASIAFLAIGLIIFKETLTPMQLVGVALGVVALIILAFAH